MKITLKDLCLFISIAGNLALLTHQESALPFTGFIITIMTPIAKAHAEKFWENRPKKKPKIKPPR